MIPPPPTTPTSEGGNICKICGKKTTTHSPDQFNECMAKSISQEILKDIKDPV